MSKRYPTLLVFLGIWFATFCMVGMTFIIFEFLFKGAVRVIVTPKIMIVWLISAAVLAIFFTGYMIMDAKKKEKLVDDLITKD